jgi:hypothetical protein
MLYILDCFCAWIGCFKIPEMGFWSELCTIYASLKQVTAVSVLAENDDLEKEAI